MPKPAADTQVTGRSRVAHTTQVAGGVVAVGALLAALGGIGGAATAQAALPMKNCGYNCEHYSWLCQYVPSPSAGEKLLASSPVVLKNVLFLDDWYAEVTVGDVYQDGETRLVVIVANLNSPDDPPTPTRADCPPPRPAPTPTTSTSTTTSTASAPTTTAPTTTTTTTTPAPVPPRATSAARSSGSPTTPRRVAAVTTYPLQPVDAGVRSESGSDLTPGRLGLVATVLLGVAALVASGWRARRPGAPRRR